MVFAGLKHDVTFDLNLDDVTHRAILDAGFDQDEDERGLRRIMVAAAIEVVSAWPGATFEAVFAARRPETAPGGLRVASLAHVLAFKIISQRDKHQREAEVIREAGRE
jgi:hypothetical protein